MGNNPVGHFFQEGLNEIGDVAGGLVNTVVATAKGLTGGGFNYSKAGRDFGNFGIDFANQSATLFGGGQPLKRLKAPLSQGQRDVAAVKAANDPNASWNKANWESVSSTVKNSHYGVQSGNAGVVSPSYLMSISDPTTKMAIALSRGTNRMALKASGFAMDVKMANMISRAREGGTPPSSTNGDGTPPDSTNSGANGGGPSNPASTNSGANNAAPAVDDPQIPPSR
jgi:hypothetical protein